MNKHATWDVEQKYLTKEYATIIGKTVETVRPMSDEEIDDFGWYRDISTIPMLIIFTDGTVLIPSSDPEGNSPGHLFVEALESE